MGRRSSSRAGLSGESDLFWGSLTWLNELGLGAALGYPAFVSTCAVSC
ncbi:MAG: hypothetical protein GSR85_10470 [Desulfurococcales archaeon]|nr:hypothetical protein [Desulfurococcales archaeon]